MLSQTIKKIAVVPLMLAVVLGVSSLKPITGQTVDTTTKSKAKTAVKSKTEVRRRGFST